MGRFSCLGLLLLSLVLTCGALPQAGAEKTASILVLPSFGESPGLPSRTQAPPDEVEGKNARQFSSMLHNETKEAVSSSCPTSCFRPNPVCGVNGVTYWCGHPDAECAGVEVESVGFCDIGSKETGGKGVLAVQSLLLVHMLWLVLAGFLVLLGLP